MSLSSFRLVLLGWTFVAVSACSWGKDLQRTAGEQDPKQQRLNAVVQHCKALVPHHADVYSHYLIKLAQDRDFEALKAIYDCDFTFSEWAAGETARILDSQKVVAFCQQFPE